MGMFVTVLLTVLDVIPTLDPTVVPRPPVLRSPLFTIHVVSLLFAYASFALACVLGVTYVLLFKEIKAKHLGFFYARLPSLQVLDVMNGRVLTIGWVFLTLGLVVGASGPPRCRRRRIRARRRCRLRTPRFSSRSSPGYSFALYARRAIGWSGRRAAWLSAIAFAIVLLNFVPWATS